MDKTHIKFNLYNACEEFINKRIATAQKVIDESQNAANNETKSSAGDKYETGRAMMQLEKQKASTQLAETNKLKKVLPLLKPEILRTKIEVGSIVITNKGKFYISISMGKVVVEGDIYMAISPVTPIGKMLLSNELNGLFVFNGTEYVVEEIY